MPYLVDGNNVMALIAGWDADKAAARRRLIQDLAQFVAVCRAKVRVVFDGVPDDEFPEGRKFRSVLISYARIGSDADSRIKELVRKSSYKRDLLVVSSDRSLAAFARRYGAKVISAGKFRRALEEACVAEATPMKTRPEGTVNVEEWMEFFSKKPH